MTNAERQKITVYQLQGLGYKKISALTGISVNTVKSYCRKHPVEVTTDDRCLFCGEVIHQTPRKKRKKFCSDKCRFAWWTTHPNERKPKTFYRHTCLFCGSEFKTARSESRYCSTDCFANARRKEVTHDEGSV